jgi:hypothetical protein
LKPEEWEKGADWVRQLLGDREKLDRMKAASRQRIHLFSYRTIVGAVESIMI